MFSIFNRKSKKLYPDIPRVKSDYMEYPSKLFVIEQELMSEFTIRVLHDGDEKRSGYVNHFYGPTSDKNDFRIGVPPEKIIELLSKQKERVSNIHSLSGSKGFKFGAVDIVTYPFYYALINDIELNSHNLSDKLWRINNNLVNEFVPNISSGSGAITIFHFNESPLDDAPVHNIVLFSDKSVDDLGRKYDLILESPLKAIYVNRESSIMDDRYLLSQRREGDGEPFDLSIITSALGLRT
ncbi:hypothetical protein [Vibrio parahaemolyticus]|uniref:hypothetical protein n=1 Tax=Vibrio parahaemolyticus TaxID=670 RepID=UPI001E6538E1|nr:hypothetical protein [Vibrio parahaemolyticus]MCQ9048963.1 hypothetical protein [Vibrio parahaemolyticus]